MTAPPATPRAGLGVLLYGDDRFERDYITAVLAARSIAVVGPFADVPGALQAVDAPGLCAAVIAYPHGGTAARGLAGALARRGIPYLTLTRATHSTVADDRPFLTRPFAAHQVADWVAGRLRRRRRPDQSPARIQRPFQPEYIDMPNQSDAHRDLFVTGLRNAHAVEKQALAIMTPQVARIEHYPELAERLRLHIEETNDQIGRLDEILETLDTSGSRLKDAALSLSGSMAAIVHTVAGDEILKNSFANYAFEHFEIAGYKSLLTLAEDGFADAVPLLRQSLDEEVSMAQWLDDALPSITRRYAQLYAESGSHKSKV